MFSIMKTNEHRPAFPSITVITVHINRIEGVSDALWSVKRQLYPAGHIVIHIGPGDDIACARNGNLLTCDYVFCEPGQNRFHAINKGISMATGDVIAILDPTDYYAHNRVLWTVAKVLAPKDMDACYGDAVLLYGDNRFKLQQYRSPCAGEKCRDRNASLPPHSAVFMKRRVYEELGGFRSDLGENAERELLERFFHRYGVKAMHVPHPFVVKKRDSDWSLCESLTRMRKRSSESEKSAAWGRIAQTSTPWARMSPTGSLAGHRTISFGSWLDRDWPAPLTPSDKSKDPTQMNPLDILSARAVVHHAPSCTDKGLYIVTVNYESDKAVQKLARSLEQLDVVKKFIVVDHSPCPRLKIPETSFPIEIIEQPNRGYGAGVNRGLRAVDEIDAVALVCNPDIEILTHHTLREAVREFKENPHWGCLIPAQVDENSHTIPVCRRFYTWKSLAQSRIWFMRRNPHIYRREHYYLDRDLTQSFDAEWANASSMFLKLSMFPYPISFDERFFLYFEDVDICAQMHVHGYSIRYYPKVVIRHCEQRQSHRSLFFFAAHVGSLLRFVRKYRGLPQAFDLQRKTAPPLTRRDLDE